MKKIIIIMILLLGFLSFKPVNAREVMLDQSYESVNLLDEIDNIADKKEKENSLTLDDDPTIECRGEDGEGFLDEDAYDLMMEIFNYIRIIAPILLILLTSIDFAQAVISQDNDALKKATSKITKRAIATVLVFFVPTIIRAIFMLPGIKDSIVSPGGGGSDPLCGIK